MANKHRMMINVDPAVYEWIRKRAHDLRVSMSGIVNQLAIDKKQEGGPEPCETNSPNAQAWLKDDQ